MTCFFCWCKKEPVIYATRARVLNHAQKLNQAKEACPRVAWETRDTFYVLVDRGSEQPGALTYGQPCADFFSMLSVSWVAQEDISRFLSFSSFFSPVLCTRRSVILSACLFSYRSTSVSSFLPSFLFLSWNALLIRLVVSRETGRPAGNPLLARSISSPGRGIGEVYRRLVMSLSRVSHICIRFTLGCGSL